VPGLGFRLVLAVAGAAVALTAGFAGVTFVRLIGMVVLGQPRPAEIRPRLWDYRLGGRAAIAGLGAACLVLAALTPLEIRVVAAGLSPIVPASATSGALKSPWVLQPVFAGFSILSPSWLWIAMPVLFTIVVLLTLGLSGRRMFRVRKVPAWRSATAGVTGSARYTAFGFANPTRRVLATVLHTRTEVRRIGPGHGATGAGTGLSRDGAAAHVGYESDVIEVTEQYLYRPLLGPLMALARQARRLQSGRLDAYLAYMLIALVAVLAVVIALA
jgi:hydrogenase-4 component B